MKKTKKLMTLIALCLSLTLSAPELLPAFSPITTVEAATVKLNKSKVTMIKGQKYSLKLKGTKKKVTWKSSNIKVATVSSTGKVTAKSKGKATITAKANKKTYKCKVTVETPKLSKKSATLKVGKTLQLKLNGTTQKVKWKSNKTSIASVNSKGKIVAKKAGKCIITATVSGKNYKCNITVKKPVENTSGNTNNNTGNTNNNNSTSESTYVWLPATGSKYHSISNCGRMNPNKATKVTIEEAIELNYDACDKCF